MPTIRSTINVDASPKAVFDAVAHVENFAAIVPAIQSIEFHGDQRRGVGTLFTETRLNRGRESSSDFEVTEYDEPHRVRIVTEAGGAIWDTVFTTNPDRDGTTLSMVMDAKPQRLLARVVIPLTTSMIAKAVHGDMEAVKAHCEAAQTSAD